MANTCMAEIFIKGIKDDVDEFINILKADYDYNNMKFTHIPHFYRISNTNVFDYYVNNTFAFAAISIECAWSVYVCMLPGEHTYYNGNMNNEEHKKRHTNIIEVSKKHNLEIEIWSEEPGIGFKEHYHIINGQLLINDCLPYYEIFISNYSTYEDFKNDNPNVIITEEEFNNAKPNIIISNGYDDGDWVMTADLPDYLYRVEMVKRVNK